MKHYDRAVIRRDLRRAEFDRLGPNDQKSRIRPGSMNRHKSKTITQRKR